jgi:hypothetical protein
VEDFQVRMLDCPTPRWWIWEEHGVPGVCVSLPVQAVNRRDVSVALVSAHLEGTEGIAFCDEYVVAPYSQTNIFLGARTFPVVTEEGKVFTGDVIFIDSTGARHHGATISFEPPPSLFPPTGAIPACAFCGDSIDIADYCAMLNGVAHRRCIWNASANTSKPKDQITVDS